MPIGTGLVPLSSILEVSHGPRQPYQRFVGIDIAAATFTGSISTGSRAPTRPFTLSQSPEGFATLIERLQADGVPPAATLVVMEATGSY
jgi:transposase